MTWKRILSAVGMVGLFMLVGVGTPAMAQLPSESILNFSYDIEESLIDVAMTGPGSVATFQMTITDTSLDSAQSSEPANHRIIVHSFTSDSLEPAEGAESTFGWTYEQPSQSIILSRAGDVHEVTFRVKHIPSARARMVLLHGSISIEAQQSGFNITQDYEVAVRIRPDVGVTMIPKLGDVPSQVAPGQVVVLPFAITNPTYYPQQIRVEASAPPQPGLNPARLGLSGTGQYTLQAFETKVVNITLLAPQEDFWYYSESFQIQVRAESVENPNAFKASGAVITVNGFNWQASGLIVMLLLLLILVLVILFLLLARRHYHERVLGKPVPPWTIHEEKTYLNRLRTEDPKRFYVVRYFLMEEEYQSALLWFHHYKKRSKKQIKQASRAAKYEDKAENLDDFTGDNYDRRAERWNKWYAWRRERVKKKRDRKIARLEKKLETRHEKDFNKDHKKWEKKVEKLTKKVNKPILKARKKWEKERDKKLDAWEKQVADLQTDHEKQVEKLRNDYEKQVKKQDKDAWKDWKAEMAEVQAENKVREKEGRDPLPLPELKSSEVDAPDYPPAPDLPAKPKLPPEPKLTEPEDLPPEPTLEKPALRDSKYAKKVNRIEAKAEKKQRKLDRKEAKRLAKIERKRATKAAKQARKRNDYVVEANEAYKPSLLERAFRLTPEDHERRARKNLVKALHEDELAHVREAEENQLDRLRANAKRQEAELEAQLIRQKAQVRTTAAHAGKDVAPAQEQEFEKLEEKLEELRRKNKEELQKAEVESEKRIEKESERIQREIEEREGLGDKESSKGTPSQKSGKS